MIPFHDDWLALGCSYVGLMLYEIFGSSLIVANEYGVIVGHELLPDLLIAMGLEELVDLDVVGHMVILCEVHDEHDEEVHGDHEEYGQQSHDAQQFHLICYQSIWKNNSSNIKMIWTLN